MLKWNWTEGRIRSVKIGRGVTQECCLSLILFNLRGDYRAKEALEGLKSFQAGQAACTVKYAYDLALLASEEAVLQGMIDKITEVIWCDGMEMNVERKLR